MPRLIPGAREPLVLHQPLEMNSYSALCPHYGNWHKRGSALERPLVKVKRHMVGKFEMWQVENMMGTRPKLGPYEPDSVWEGEVETTFATDR